MAGGDWRRAALGDGQMEMFGARICGGQICGGRLDGRFGARAGQPQGGAGEEIGEERCAKGGTEGRVRKRALTLQG